MGLARGTLKMIPTRMVFQINDGDKGSINVQRRIDRCTISLFYKPQ